MVEAKRLQIATSEVISNLESIQLSVIHGRQLKSVLDNIPKGKAAEGEVKDPITDEVLYKVPIDNQLLKTVYYAGFYAYMQVRSEGMEDIANDVLLREGLPQEISPRQGKKLKAFDKEFFGP